MIEAHADVQRQAPVHFPTVLHERFDVGKPVVSHHPAAFAVAVEIAQEHVGVSVARVEWERTGAGETVASKVGSTPGLLHLARTLVINSSLDAVGPAQPANVVVEAVNVVPVRVGSVASVRRTDGAARHRRSPVSEVLRAIGQTRPLQVSVVLEGRRILVKPVRWIAHPGPVHLRWVVRVPVPGIIALAKSEFVDHSRTDRKCPPHSRALGSGDPPNKEPTCLRRSSMRCCRWSPPDRSH